MATATLHMGYVGHAKVGPTNYFITGSSLNPAQTVEAPDVVAGYEMRRGWNYAKVETGGNITGPIHENATSLWAETINRTAEKDHLANKVNVEIAYYGGMGRTFPDCYIGSLNIACTAGDVATFTIDFMTASRPTPLTTSITPVDCAKLITWDRCSMDIAGLTSQYAQSFTITVNNNLQRAYAISTTSISEMDLFPIDVPAGVREITGTISFYAQGQIDAVFPVAPGAFGANKWSEYTAGSTTNITFNVGGIINQTFKSKFHRAESAATTGLTIYTVNFTGVCDLV